jgi:hypothetical protein
MCRHLSQSRNINDFPVVHFGSRRLDFTPEKCDDFNLQVIDTHS